MEKTTQKTRKSWSADDKISVIRKHMQKSKMVDTCEENRVHPTMLSAWIKTVLEAGREALAGSNKKEFREKEKLISTYQKEIDRKNRIIAELTGEIIDLKREWGELKNIHVDPEIRKDILNTLERLKKLTGLPMKTFSDFLGLNIQKLSEWGSKKSMNPNRKIPKGHWSTPDEQRSVVEFKKQNMNVGYVRLTWMMVDRNVAFLSPSSVYRILVNASLNNKWTRPAGEPKKEGFDQPTKIHEHWHTDISYINFKGTFVYLISVLDGYSRAILAWDIRTTMESLDVQIVLWRACENWLDEKRNDNPRVITDNGSQFLTSEFKSVLREFSLTNIRTSVNHPQSNGKLERFHGTIKSEAIRNMPKFTLEQMKKEVGDWIEYYNFQRLHSSLQYVAPMDVVECKQELILAERKRKLLEGKQMRKKYSESIRNNLEAVNA